MNHFICDEVARIENFLERQTGAPRLLFIKLMRKKKIKVNGKNIKFGFETQIGDRITVFCNIEKQPAKTSNSKILEKMILYENKDLIVINKTGNIASQGGVGINVSIDTCANSLAEIQGKRSFFIVHRLDYDVTGTMIIAKNAQMCKKLGKDFQNNQVDKIYLAVLFGKVEEIITIEDPIEGKWAKSIIYPILKKNDCTVCFIKIFSGRKHQIKIHVNNCGFPIVNENNKTLLHCFFMNLANLKFWSYPKEYWKDWINFSILIEKFFLWKKNLIF